MRHLNCKRYNSRRQVIGIIIALLILTVSFTSPVRYIFEFPEEIRLLKGEVEKFEVNFPFTLYVEGQEKNSILVDDETSTKHEVNYKVRSDKTVEITPLKIGNIDLEFRLFGCIPLRSLEAEVIEPFELIPSGKSIGIKLSPADAMVVGFHEIKTNEGEFSPGKAAGIKKGDAILEVEGMEMKDLEKTVDILSKYSKKQDEIELVIDRNGKEKKMTVEPHKCAEESQHLTGIYIKDTKAGVGTMTYIEPENDRFGALGHSISDPASGRVVEITNGKLVEANIINVIKGEESGPGEKQGAFKEGDDYIGTIDKNEKLGVFGQSHIDHEGLYYDEPMPIALSQHVEEGEAEMLTVIKGDKIESFDIEIVKSMPRNINSGKGMVIKVTDSKLIDKTGGIIQGMSGSPIIQDGKIVGSVTHVFLNDAKKGYAAFIEWMLDDSGEIVENF